MNSETKIVLYYSMNRRVPTNASLTETHKDDTFEERYETLFLLMNFEEPRA